MYLRRTIKTALFFALTLHGLFFFVLTLLIDKPELMQFQFKDSMDVSLTPMTPSKVTPHRVDPTSSSGATPSPKQSDQSTYAIKKHEIKTKTQSSTIKTIDKAAPFSVDHEEVKSQLAAALNDLAPDPILNEPPNNTQAAAAKQNLAIELPSSVLMEMKIEYIENGKSPVYGRADWRWKSSTNELYHLEIDARLSVIFVEVNLYKGYSRGFKDASFIKPIEMSEKRRNRSEVATHFSTYSDVIRFSSSNKVLEKPVGVQDKFSIVMQFVAMGNSQPNLFFPGQSWNFWVADERDLTEFVFHVRAKEIIKTPLGELEAWHIVRPPKEGSFHSTLEIWFAPQIGWLPIQIKNTERNGTVTVQQISSFKRDEQDGPLVQ